MQRVTITSTSNSHTRTNHTTASGSGRKRLRGGVDAVEKGKGARIAPQFGYFIRLGITIPRLANLFGTCLLSMLRGEP